MQYGTIFVNKITSRTLVLSMHSETVTSQVAVNNATHCQSLYTYMKRAGQRKNYFHGKIE